MLHRGTIETIFRLATARAASFDTCAPRVSLAALPDCNTPFQDCVAMRFLRHRFYSTAEWRKARAQALHDFNYQCTGCGISLENLGRGAHVHHRKSLERAPALRSEPLNLRPLCVTCHTIEHEHIKRPGGCDESGVPTHSDHPWNK